MNNETVRKANKFVYKTFDVYEDYIKDENLIKKDASNKTKSTLGTMIGSISLAYYMEHHTFLESIMHTIRIYRSAKLFRKTFKEEFTYLDS